MNSKASAPATDWAAVRQAYVHDDVAVREICREHGIRTETLYRRARNEGWPTRRSRREGNDAEAASMKLVARLRRIAEDQIAELEARRATQRQRGGGEPERDARVLNELVRLIERIAAVEAKHQVRQDGAPGWSQAERAERRTALANKLIAMLEQERGSPLPDKPER